LGLNTALWNLFIVSPVVIYMYIGFLLNMFYFSLLVAFMTMGMFHGVHGDAYGNWTRVLLTDYVSKGAVCLDGSPGAYYIRTPLTETNENNWVVFHEGGGEFYHIHIYLYIYLSHETLLSLYIFYYHDDLSCFLVYQPFFFNKLSIYTSLTNTLPGWCMGDANCWDRAQTDLGSSKNYPEVLGAWEAPGLAAYAFPHHTFVYARYCDGGSWTGNNVTNFQGNTLYYRGRPLLDALFTDLNARGYIINSNNPLINPLINPLDNPVIPLFE